ncbi:hypothetical protein DDT56_22975 [Brenneria corticis]|uniref:Uncharacterized protein n=1 Tax=Brenneria corticis TaxID=2173106 RepID=A0A2U1TKH0_9GAMM|nr:hypothetical protein DDT56_22975 [Brenneria sp. CFCC 11842]
MVFIVLLSVSYVLMVGFLIFFGFYFYQYINLRWICLKNPTYIRINRDFLKINKNEILLIYIKIQLYKL